MPVTPANDLRLRCIQAPSGGKRSARSDEQRCELRRDVEIDVEHEERERLPVRVEVERVVDAAVEHAIEYEVHRTELRQQVAAHTERLPVAERFGHSRFGDLFDEQ